jgi:C4-dicarboxylate transporter, DctM subunit
MLFMILIGALLFASFINYTSMPADLKSFVTMFGAHSWMVIVAICAVYILLGTAMEELSMILLTVPLFFPVVTSLGYDPIWFGIMVVLVVQIGMISPPVGMNIFVVKNLLPHVPIGTIFRGTTPFSVALIVMLALLLAFPGIATWLPGYMK